MLTGCSSRLFLTALLLAATALPASAQDALLHNVPAQGSVTIDGTAYFFAAQPVEVTALLDGLEKIIGKPARRELLPMRPIDVLETFADSSELQRATGFAPRTSIDDGLRAFVTWYRGYRGNT